MGVHGLCGRVAGSAGSICPQDRIAVICRKAMFTHPGANPRLPEHKNADFVLEKPENGGSEAEKRTKTSILCSKSPKTRVPNPKKAQKPRFCARKARKQGFQTQIKHKKPDFVLGKRGCTQQNSRFTSRMQSRGLPRPSPRQMDERIAGQHTLLSFYRRYVIAETLTEIGIGKHNLREAYRKRGLPANHRARQCTLELPGRRIRVRYELQERHTQPSCSRIRHPTPAHRHTGQATALSPILQLRTGQAAASFGGDAEVA